MTNYDDIKLPPVECTRCGAHAPDPSTDAADSWQLHMLTYDGMVAEGPREDNAAMVLWCPECAAKPLPPEGDIASPALQARAKYAAAGPQRLGDLSSDNLIDDLIRFSMRGNKLDDTMRGVLTEQLQQDLRILWVMDYEGGGSEIATQLFLTEARIIAAILADTK